MQTIEFPDKLVTYDTFMNDLAERIAYKLQRAANDPEFINQRKAFSMFGRANVERWRRTGQVKCYKRALIRASYTPSPKRKPTTRLSVQQKVSCTKCGFVSVPSPLITIMLMVTTRSIPTPTHSPAARRLLYDSSSLRLQKPARQPNNIFIIQKQ